MPYLQLSRIAFDQPWSSSNDNIYNTNSGNVGVGITSPAARLDVNGNVYIASSTNIGGNLNLQNQVITLNGIKGQNNQALVSNANGVLSWINMSDVINQYISNTYFLFTGDSPGCPAGYITVQKWWLAASGGPDPWGYTCGVEAKWYEASDPAPCCHAGVSASACSPGWNKITCKLDTKDLLVYGNHKINDCLAFSGASTSTSEETVNISVVFPPISLLAPIYQEESGKVIKVIPQLKT